MIGIKNHFLFFTALALLVLGCKDKPNTNFQLNLAQPFNPELRYYHSSQYANRLGNQVNYGSFLSLHLYHNSVIANTPIAGNYKFVNDTLVFNPLVSLGSNLTFIALFINGTDTVKEVFTTPSINAAFLLEPKVETIYPTVDEIPANILMFHVLFNKPLSEDEMAYKQVKIIDQNGEEKVKVWKEKSYWLQDGKHLVLMVHPGRVKRGINDLKYLGVLFEPNKKYSLIISDSLTDVDGNKLSKLIKKEFKIIKPDYSKPKLVSINYSQIKANSNQAIKFTFSEPMDYASLFSGIKVEDNVGHLISGELVQQKQDKIWFFKPAANWQNAEYKITLTDVVADLASNFTHRLFEIKDTTNLKGKDIIYRFTPN